MKHTPQSTRLIKAHCPACGYTMRVTMKWLLLARPACPSPGCGRRGVEVDVDLPKPKGRKP